MVNVPPTGAAEELVVDRRTGQSWRVPVHPFEIATTVVTHELWCHTFSLATAPELTGLPHTEVNWRETILFCNELSLLEGLEPAYSITRRDVPEPATWRPHSQPATDDWAVTWNHRADGYRLPTDAEWQVACRAGTSGARYAPLDEAGWYEANSGGRLRPVGSKNPNPWGLYDMLGGVWEWCWDHYDLAVYGAYRIIRGGGWNDPEWSCRAGVRRKTSPTAHFDDLGFRLARGATEKPAVRPSWC